MNTTLPTSYLYPPTSYLYPPFSHSNPSNLHQPFSYPPLLYHNLLNRLGDRQPTATIKPNLSLYFWDSDVIYDLIDNKDYAVDIVNEPTFTNVTTESVQGEVGVSNDYFRSQNHRLEFYRSYLSEKRRDMISEYVLNTLGTRDVSEDKKKAVKTWIEACRVATYHEVGDYSFNLLSWNIFLLKDIQNLVLGGVFSLAQFGIYVLVPVVSPATVYPEEFKVKLEQLRKTYPLKTRICDQF